MNLAGFSVSTSGAIAYRVAGVSRRQLTWFDRSGKTLGTLGAAEDAGLVGPEISPDGRRVAVSRGVQGNSDVWLIDEARTTRLTFDPAVDHLPIWSSDGSRIIFDSSRRNGIHDLYQKSSGGAGSEDILLESKESKAAMDAAVAPITLILNWTPPASR